MVYQPTFPEEIKSKIFDEQTIMSYGCMSKGRSRMDAALEYTCYSADQTVRVMVDLFNKNCAADMNRINVQVS